MAQNMTSFLKASGVDARTTEKVARTMTAMMQGNPQKFLLAAQLAVAAVASPGGLLSGKGGGIRTFEGWPCKWNVPDFATDQAGMVVREMAESLAAL